MMSFLDDTEDVFDLNQAIPETELLDNSIQKGRAQLSIKTRRPRPSRSRYRDSVSSTEGDDSLDRKDGPLHSAHSPLHLAMRGSAPSPDSLLSAQNTVFSFDTPVGRRSPEDAGASLATAPRGRYHQLTNATSQEALVTPRTSCPSPDYSPVYLRRSRRPDSEVLVSDSSRDSSPAEPSPTVVLDKKTRRRFLDLGVTLRRSYIRVRKEKNNRLSVGSREASESPSRSSASFIPFSWFSEGRSSGSSPWTAPCSPKAPPPLNKSQSQESSLNQDFSPLTSSTSPPVDVTSSSSSSHPYHTLSSEPLDEPITAVSSWSMEQVCDWLRGLNMDQYVPEFTARDVDGQKLLQVDGSKLKVLGVLSSSDRSVLKRRIKDLQTAAEKEKKVLEKLEKQKEKQHRREKEQWRN